MDFPLTVGQLLIGIQVLIAVMVVVVLYHILFIVVDLRKILRRVDDITEQVEAIILKPIALADQILAKVVEMIESGANKVKKGKKKKHAHEADMIEG